VQIGAGSGVESTDEWRIEMKKTIAFAAAVLAVFLLSLAPAFAGGAGGITSGYQWFDPSVSSGDYQARFTGAYGYGVGYDGRRMGGFGMAFYSDTDPGRMVGGIGGLVTGQELRLGNMMLAATLWTGLGGLSAPVYGMEPGHLVGFAELDLEAGIAIFRWFQVSLYGGMQVMSSLAPGRPFQDFLYYSPVVGIRTSWGAF
jgi:hypothetical protein